jgi:catechol 2,3-dioxygenase-like lactoylglutathione lyase family enzyme
MTSAIGAVLDHVAIAVPSHDVACRRWRDELGGGIVTVGANTAFKSLQIRYANDARLELLAPGEAPFVGKFLERFGATVHHVTLKVPDLHEAISTIRAGGLDVIDVQDTNDLWQEGFLRPSQVGGLVVQIAWTTLTPEDFAAYTGFQPEPTRADAPALLGPRLRHPDVQRAEYVWTLLGATVDRAAGELRCSWPDSALSVVIESGPHAGPVGLRMRGTRPLPTDDDAGPAVEAV